jgi:hypothetical protein
MHVRPIGAILVLGLGACAQSRTAETGAAVDTVVTDPRVVRDTNFVERVDTVVTTKREADTVVVTTDTTITVDTVKVEGDSSRGVILDTTRTQ